MASHATPNFGGLVFGAMGLPRLMGVALRHRSFPGITPPKTNTSPENQWLEDVFPCISYYWNSTFLGDMLVFGDVLVLWHFSFDQCSTKDAWLLVWGPHRWSRNQRANSGSLGDQNSPCLKSFGTKKQFTCTSFRAFYRLLHTLRHVIEDEAESFLTCFSFFHSSLYRYSKESAIKTMRKKFWDCVIPIGSTPCDDICCEVLTLILGFISRIDGWMGDELKANAQVVWVMWCWWNFHILYIELYI